MIARAHQLMDKGYNLKHKDQVVTIFSAPNYCYRCNNLAAILEMDEHLDENYMLAYLERAKLHFYNLNIVKGCEDLKKYESILSKESVEDNKLLENNLSVYEERDMKCHEFLLYMTLKMYEQAE